MPAPTPPNNPQKTPDPAAVRIAELEAMLDAERQRAAVAERAALQAREEAQRPRVEAPAVEVRAPDPGVVLVQNNGLAPVQFSVTTFRDEPTAIPGRMERKAIAWTRHCLALGISIVPAAAWAEARKQAPIAAMLKAPAPVLPPATPMRERMHLVEVTRHDRPFDEWSEADAIALIEHPQMIALDVLAGWADNDARPSVRTAAANRRRAVIEQGTRRMEAA